MTDREAIRRYLERGPINPAHRLKTILKGDFMETSAPIEPVKSKTEVEARSMPMVFDTYNGKNPVVYKIQHHLKSHPHSALKAALVHGSIASLEETAYSDFDGILIINTGQLKTRAEQRGLRQLVRDTNRMMYEQDALQHHGWQVVFSEASVSQQEDNIVHGVWKTCRSIYPDTPVQVSVVLPGPQVLTDNFRRLTASIEKKIHQTARFSDQYFFKNLCSEILLLPAVFLQQYGHPDITKKESFNLIGDYFKSEEMIPLSKASSWREHWVQPGINCVSKQFHLLRQAGFYLSSLSPKTPPIILSQADEDWVAGMIRLISLMKKKSG